MQHRGRESIAFTLLLLLMAFIQAGLGAIPALMPALARDFSIGGDPALQSLVGALPSYATVFTSVLVSVVVDPCKGHLVRWVLTSSLISNGFVAVAIALIPAGPEMIYVVLLDRFMAGVTQAPFFVLFPVWIMSQSGPGTLTSRRMALSPIASGVGGVLGYFAGGWLVGDQAVVGNRAQSLPWRGFFYVQGGLIIMASVFLGIVLPAKSWRLKETAENASTSRSGADARAEEHRCANNDDAAELGVGVISETAGKSSLSLASTIDPKSCARVTPASFVAPWSLSLPSLPPLEAVRGSRHFRSLDRAPPLITLHRGTTIEKHGAASLNANAGANARADTHADAPFHRSPRMPSPAGLLSPQGQGITKNQMNQQRRRKSLMAPDGGAFGIAKGLLCNKPWLGNLLAYGFLYFHRYGIQFWLVDFMLATQQKGSGLPSTRPGLITFVAVFFMVTGVIGVGLGPFLVSCSQKITCGDTENKDKWDLSLARATAIVAAFSTISVTFLIPGYLTYDWHVAGFLMSGGIWNVCHNCLIATVCEQNLRLAGKEGSVQIMASAINMAVRSVIGTGLGVNTPGLFMQLSLARGTCQQAYEVCTSADCRNSSNSSLEHPQDGEVCGTAYLHGMLILVLGAYVMLVGYTTTWCMLSGCRRCWYQRRIHVLNQ